jgi:NAD(P)-dependent dehydrogenase (short-subunit alcohol dehydrogenase family)
VTRSPAEDGLYVVGGGTGALGSAVVSRLLGEGRLVIVPVRPGSDPHLQPQVRGIECDLSDPQAVEQFANTVASEGRWYAVINCSGGYASGLAHELEDEQLLEQLDLNVLGPWRLAKAGARAMIASGDGGRIVNVVSRSGEQPFAGQAGYQLGKAALLRLTEVMALELQAHAITVNAVLPSVIDTPANRRSMPGADHSRWVPPGDIAAAILWLLSTQTASVTGASLRVYGRS